MDPEGNSLSLERHCRADGTNKTVMEERGGDVFLLFKISPWGCKALNMRATEQHVKETVVFSYLFYLLKFNPLSQP